MENRDDFYNILLKTSVVSVWCDTGLRRRLFKLRLGQWMHHVGLQWPCQHRLGLF